jgi:hypothetical protein
MSYEDALRQNEADMRADQPFREIAPDKYLGPLPLRALKKRLLLKRVTLRTGLIVHAREQYGVTDLVGQLAEVMAIGPDFVQDWNGDVIAVGDLVVFNQARVHDHFRWGQHDILVYPGEWLCGKITTGVLVDDPSLREYERQPL